MPNEQPPGPSPYPNPLPIPPPNPGLVGPPTQITPPGPPQNVHINPGQFPNPNDINPPSGPGSYVDPNDLANQNQQLLNDVSQPPDAQPQTNDIGVAFQRAFEEAQQANQQRFLDVLQRYLERENIGYSRDLGDLGSLVGGFSERLTNSTNQQAGQQSNLLQGYQNMLEQLTGQQAQSSADIIGAYDQRLGRNMGYLDTYGQGKAQDIQDQYARQSASGRADLARRGLGNTTLQGNVARAAQSDQMRASLGLEDYLNRLRLEADTNLSGQGLAAAERFQGQGLGLREQVMGNMLGAQERQNTLGLQTYLQGSQGGLDALERAQQRAAQGQDTRAADTNLFMERRNDTYPAMSDLIGLAGQMGAGAGGNLGYSGSPVYVDPSRLGYNTNPTGGGQQYTTRGQVEPPAGGVGPRDGGGAGGGAPWGGLFGDIGKGLADWLGKYFSGGGGGGPAPVAGGAPKPVEGAGGDTTPGAGVNPITAETTTPVEDKIEDPTAAGIAQDLWDSFASGGGDFTSRIKDWFASHKDDEKTSSTNWEAILAGIEETLKQSGLSEKAQADILEEIKGQIKEADFNVGEGIED